ncbi:MAG: DUF4321 domain-containing protein [Clostridiaceae bacterium]
MKSSKKTTCSLIIVSILGGILGTFIGDILGNKFEFLNFLKVIYTIGTKSPLSIDLKIVDFTFGFNFNFNIMSILGVILSIIIYKRK